ncbi:MAG: hypothetical protein MJB14_06270 [Spirochaetes bacterium]|nr:hypothetical protein [Spirochaetota bacterium]
MRKISFWEKVEIIYTLFFCYFGVILVFLIKFFFKVQFSLPGETLLISLFTAFGAFYVFPRVFGIPFGEVSLKVFFLKSGLYPTKAMLFYIFLGFLLAALSLTGMAFGSFFSGYPFLGFQQLDTTQFVKSINPAFWNELFFRVILVVLLLEFMTAKRWIILIVSLLFTLTQIRGFSFDHFLSLSSIFLTSILLCIFVYRTNSLYGVITFQYLNLSLTPLFHRLPSTARLDQYFLFYSSYWIALGLGVLIVIYGTKLFSIKPNHIVYQRAGVWDDENLI